MFKYKPMLTLRCNVFGVSGTTVGFGEYKNCTTNSATAVVLPLVQLIMKSILHEFRPSPMHLQS